MPLDKRQRDVLERWLESRNVSRVCPACGAGEWRTGDIIAAPTLPGGGGTVIGGPTHPMVQVICNHCAHVRLFSSVAIGIPSHNPMSQEQSGVDTR
jgi:hypothetical protein